MAASLKRPPVHAVDSEGRALRPYSLYWAMADHGFPAAVTGAEATAMVRGGSTALYVLHR